MWIVLGTHKTELSIIRHFVIRYFDSYQEATEFADSLEWYYIDSNGIEWDLSIEPFAH